MSRWTSEQSSLLSLLLDEVVGTQEMIDIRQDYCKMLDCYKSNKLHTVYFTGSKAEGLDLPGSDEDFMFDINIIHMMAKDLRPIKVIQTLHDFEETNSYDIFLMSTENVPPGFALLSYVNPLIPRTFVPPWYQYIYDRIYFSSNWLVQTFYNFLTILHLDG